MRHPILSRLAVAAFAPVALVGALAVPAQASGVEPSTAILGLTTSVTLDGFILTVQATGTFEGGIVANNATALQVAGVETWSTGGGVVKSRPLAAAPSAVRFVNSNTVEYQIELNHWLSDVHLDWTAEAAGLAPTPFIGTCAGTYTLTARTEVTVKSC